MAKDNIDPEELRNQLIIMKEQLQKSIKNKGPASMSAVSSVEPDMDYGQINIQIKQVHQPKRVRKGTNEDIEGIGETMEEPDSPKMVKKRIVKKKSPAKQPRDQSAEKNDEEKLQKSPPTQTGTLSPPKDGKKKKKTGTSPTRGVKKQKTKIIGGPGGKIFMGGKLDSPTK